MLRDGFKDCPRRGGKRHWSAVNDLKKIGHNVECRPPEDILMSLVAGDNHTWECDIMVQIGFV